jgi:hypothetical protein
MPVQGYRTSILADSCSASPFGTLSCMVRPVKVEPLSGYRLRVRYADGVEGIIDLSEQVRRGVFAPLRDDALFRNVQIGDRGQIAWSDDLDICPDSAYLEITGKIPARAKNA